MNRKSIKRAGEKQRAEGKQFRLAKEVASIQRRAAEHDGRFVTIGQLVFFSTETGDAWMLARPLRSACGPTRPRWGSRAN
jgi:hypothetical protein